jgi:hypothetical protein
MVQILHSDAVLFKPNSHRIKIALFRSVAPVSTPNQLKALRYDKTRQNQK